uniref:Putative primase n=1 Tax=viral metagenome TaxID=1070528 RepID=A0A6M3IJ29_9ZZZZ
MNLIDIVSTFDLTSYLDDREVSYVREGKNVTANWIEIKCVFCFSDPSEHLGINLASKMFNCWRCGSKGDIVKLIQTIDNCSFKQVVITLKTFQDYYSFKELKQDIRRRSPNENILPSGITKKFTDEAISFLEDRDFDFEMLTRKYDLYYTGHLGKYNFRILIPIYLEGRIVNFTCRRIMEDKKVNKYMHCSNEEAIIPVKELFYNSDRIFGDRAIIVEGPGDVWRLGDGALASFGIEVSPHQLFFLKRLVNDKGLKKLFVLFDAEDLAQKRALDLATKISTFCDVEKLELDEGDPGGLSNEEVKKLRKEILNG